MFISFSSALEHPYFQIFASLVQKITFIYKFILRLSSWPSFLAFDFFTSLCALEFWFTGSLWLGGFDSALCSVSLLSCLVDLVLWLCPQDQSRT